MDFRIQVVQRNVARGKQGRCDLESAEKHGCVVRSRTLDLSRAIAREYAAVVDSGKRSKRNI